MNDQKTNHALTESRLNAGLAADKLDAERWRTFLRISEKEINRENGCIKFYLPRYFRKDHQFGFMTFEQTIDAAIERAANVL